MYLKLIKSSSSVTNTLYMAIHIYEMQRWDVLILKFLATPSLNPSIFEFIQSPHFIYPKKCNFRFKPIKKCQVGLNLKEIVLILIFI